VNPTRSHQNLPPVSPQTPANFYPAAHLPPPPKTALAGDGDGDGDDDGFFRQVFKELYDAKAIAAVLQEWYKTMADMPLILRQAAQMGLFSSAALVRFLAMDVRPNVTRFVTRSLPPAVSWSADSAGGCWGPALEGRSAGCALPAAAPCCTVQ
jgi:hypothetical protein